MITESINIKIVTPENVVFEDNVDWVTLPVSDGEVTILPNHMPYIALLREGEILAKKSGSRVWLAISGGFIEFSNNQLVILADTAERAEDIDLARAEEAKKRAEDTAKKNASVDSLEFEKAIAAIKRATFRIKVVKKHRTKNLMNVGS